MASMASEQILAVTLSLSIFLAFEMIVLQTQFRFVQEKLFIFFAQPLVFVRKGLAY